MLEPGVSAVDDERAGAGRTVRLLGLPLLRAGGAETPLPARRPFQLLAYLACRRAWVSRSELAELFWPERPEGHARGNLRTLLLRARQMPGVDDLELQAERVRWRPASDLERFEAAAAAGRDEDLLALPWAPLLEGLEPGLSEPALQWLASERERLVALWRAAARRRMAACLQHDTGAALRLAERAVEIDPWDASTLLALAEAARACGEPQRGIEALQAHAQRLRAVHGLDPPAALRAALAQLEAAQGTGFEGSARGPAPAATAVAPPPPAPETTPPGRLIGRRAELDRLLALLTSPAGPRVVLISGPGGIGKTSLALAAQPLLAPHLPGGSAWVPLADLSEPAQLAGRVASVLGTTLAAAGEATAQLLAWIAARGPLVLLLDNAEHLAGLDEQLDAWLAAAPALRLVLTSRSRQLGALAAHEAAVLALEGLPLPDEDDASDEGNADEAQALRRFDSVRLFETRALAVEPRFALAPQARALVRLLHATEGLPLAIELAAAMSPLLSVPEILQSLAEGSLDVLDTAGRPDATRGPRGLRGCFERSWSLLDARLRDALARLAALPAGFDRELAERVALAPLPVLVALHDASLVQRDGDTRAGAAARYSLHLLLRRFVAEKAPLGGDEAARLLERLTAFVAHRLEPWDQPGQLGDAAGLDAVEALLPQLRLVWRHVAVAGPAAVMARIARVLGRYHVARGRIDEVLPLFEELLPRLAGSDRAGLRAKAAMLRTQAMLEYHRGRLAAAIEHARQALRWATQANDPHTAVGCLTVLGNALYFSGEPAQAGAHFRNAAARGQRLGDLHVVAAATGGLGLVERSRGRFEAAIEHYRVSRATSAALGNPAGEIVDCLNMADSLQGLGRHAEAIAVLDEAQALAARHRIDSKRALMLTSAAHSHLALGQNGPARQRLDEAGRWLQASSDGHTAVERLLAQAELDRLDGAPAAMAATLARAFEAARQGGSPISRLHALELHGQLLQALGEVADAGRTWLWIQAQPACTAAMRRRTAALLDALLPGDDARHDLAARPPADGTLAGAVDAALAHCRALAAAAR